MIKLIKKFQIKLTPFDATKEWVMNTNNNQDLLLFDTGSYQDLEVPIASEFIDYGNINDSPQDNFECDISLEQQPDDLINTRIGLKTIGLFYPDTDPLNIDNTYKRIVYSQIKSMFYNQYKNVAKTWGIENIDFNLGKTERKLSDEFRLFDIPQSIYGDRIIPGSVVMHDFFPDTNLKITDDSYGNLVAGSNLFSKQQEIGEHQNAFMFGSDSTCGNYFSFIPGSPINLTVISGSAILTWNVQDNKTNYFSVWKSLDGISYSEYTNSILTTYTDVNVSSGNTYWYKVSAINSYGTSSFSNTASIIFPFAFPTASLLQRLESIDFNSTPSGSQVTQWTDLSGNGNHVYLTVSGSNGISGINNGPLVDTIRTANGNNTLRFDSLGHARALSTPKLFISQSNPSALELFAVFKNDYDPNILSNDNSIFQYTQETNRFIGNPLFIWTCITALHDNTAGGYGIAGGHWVEQFGNGWHNDLSHQLTLDLGGSIVNSSASFVAYNLSIDGANSYSASMNGIYFAKLSTGSYKYITHGVETRYAVGGAIRYGLGGSFAYMNGNIASIMIWGKKLSDGERSAVQSYITSKYGVNF